MSPFAESWAWGRGGLDLPPQIVERGEVDRKWKRRLDDRLERVEKGASKRGMSRVGLVIQGQIYPESILRKQVTNLWAVP